MKTNLRHWVVVAILTFVTANSNAALIFQDVTLEGNTIGQLQFDSDAVYSDLLFAFEDPFFDLNFEIDGMTQTASDDINFDFGPVFFFDLADLSKGVIGMSFISSSFEIIDTMVLDSTGNFLGDITIHRPQQVSEPMSFALLFTGLLFLLAKNRRPIKQFA
ncbi:PEP-CTERM sorting domain-containing protein [Aestuariibacter sp. A3R04]|uniref:PEP-CTERM sorting domain-containing protein n=1 Tax=Aestuariibacter sp. A3R04 TaxID=2841571 RepID=UPI001C08623E|nr:PEP-CTERM sorting domain-containing protein [Aestuariibacter sp. A3R04]MBU3021336.1 PEP-CTERM sorting domain-containing protein [Aestuariibacter sp. A3R04]